MKSLIAVGVLSQSTWLLNSISHGYFRGTLARGCLHLQLLWRLLFQQHPRSRHQHCPDASQLRLYPPCQSLP